MRDRHAPPYARVAAARELLDRGYGKAPQAEQVHVTGDWAKLAARLASARERVGPL